MKRETLRDLCLVILVIAQPIYVTCEATTEAAYRDKRTIDSVLRSVADAFGYDIQKRPSLLPAMVTTGAPPVSTHFPPPLQPLPPVPKPALRPRASAAPPRPPAPPPAKLPKIPFVPPLRPLPQPNPPPKAAPPPPPPPKAPPPPPKAAPPNPAPPAPAAKSPLTPALVERFQKTFNLNFNWNKSVNPPNPPPKQPPAPAAPVPPAAKPAPPPNPPAAPAPPNRPAAPAPSAKFAPGGQIFIKKPQLYRENVPEHVTFNDYNETPETNAQLNNDYTEEENQLLNQDYSESTKNFATKPHEDEQASARENYKNSVNEFWKNYPFAAQHGYKYIAPENLEGLHAPRQFSKYEEYNIEPKQKGAACKKKLVQKPRVEEVQNADDVQDYDDSYTRIYLLPRHHENPNEHLHEDEEEEKHISEAETIAHPLFSGILPAQLHQLASSESESKPFSIPFDYQSSGSEIKSKVVVQNKTKPACCGAETTSSEDFDFYTVPEPKPVDYSQFEKLFSEDDEKLSKNAKIKTNQQSYSILHSNKYEKPMSW